MLSDFPLIDRISFETLQVNIGYKCNQTCIHCHVNAGPHRWEMMNDENISKIPRIIKLHNIKTLDITGGAPELHPRFKDLVKSVRDLNVKVIDRCNLTILSEKGYEDMAKFLASNKVDITASLPCYLEENVDKQRGEGVFKKSILGLKELNSLGYGLENSDLILNLVYNPIGPHLPPSQKHLEQKYKSELLNRHGIHFTKLLALANMPINRFADFLSRQGKLEDYEELLKENHNPNNIKSLMCRSSISVDWNGNLYDCDFNQQLGISQNNNPKNLHDLLRENIKFNGQKITVDKHCFGCTAGSGSSCGGALT